MTPKEAVEEIIKRYNAGDKDGAKRLLLIAQMILPDKTKEFFQIKLGLIYKINKPPEQLKFACDLMGGKITDKNGIKSYENKTPQKGEAGE